MSARLHVAFLPERERALGEVQHGARCAVVPLITAAAPAAFALSRECKRQRAESAVIAPVGGVWTHLGALLAEVVRRVGAHADDGVNGFIHARRVPR